MTDRHQNEIIERLSALLDGESEHAEADRALLRDPAAAEQFRRLLALDRLLSALPEPEVSATFESRVMAALPVEQPPVWGTRIAWGALAAGLLLAVALGLYLALPEAKTDSMVPAMSVPDALALDTGEALSLREEFAELDTDTTLWLAEWAAPSWEPISGSISGLSSDQVIEALAVMAGDAALPFEEHTSLLQVVDAIEQFTETETAAFNQLLRAALSEV